MFFVFIVYVFHVLLLCLFVFVFVFVLVLVLVFVFAFVFVFVFVFSFVPVSLTPSRCRIVTKCKQFNFFSRYLWSTYSSAPTRHQSDILKVANIVPLDLEKAQLGNIELHTELIILIQAADS